ncbi:hypothetical protein ES695_01425 [Candidatus Atribacteria bacterium 1244-E10-H5-B2]|nr:MAG: hypothetical protein ES695_01425 [Candidatus Atribacteria bacterium 1244-E10-H5-B2]
MNKNQKIILAIFVPVIIFLVTLTIAYYLGVERSLDSKSLSFGWTHNPFDWGKTWYLWLFSLIGIILFEYGLFEDKK